MPRNRAVFVRRTPPPAGFLAATFDAIRRLIGNTPMLAIDVRFRGRYRRIHVKAEQLNLTGSIKDRMALFILQRAYFAGRISPGDTIAEASSGNTGIAFAALGGALRHPVRIFMPDGMSRERRRRHSQPGRGSRVGHAGTGWLRRQYPHGGGTCGTRSARLPAAPVLEHGQHRRPTPQRPAPKSGSS